MSVKIDLKATPVVWIEINGEKREPLPYDPDKDTHKLGPLPRTRDDDGLVGRLLDWSMKAKVYSLRGMTSGGGIYTALYLPEDAEKVLAWLAEQGIEPGRVNTYNGEDHEPSSGS